MKLITGWSSTPFGAKPVCLCLKSKNPTPLTVTVTVPLTRWYFPKTGTLYLWVVINAGYLQRLKSYPLKSLILLLPLRHTTIALAKLPKDVRAAISKKFGGKVSTISWSLTPETKLSCQQRHSFIPCEHLHIYYSLSIKSTLLVALSQVCRSLLQTAVVADLGIMLANVSTSRSRHRGIRRGGLHMGESVTTSAT